MRKIDFSQTGGYPLSQNTLDWLQLSYRDSIKAVVEMGGTGPIALSGCVVNNPTSSTVSVTDGWVYYQGEIYQVTGGGPLSTITFGSYPCVILHPVDSPVTYNNGAVHSSIHYGAGLVGYSSSNTDNSVQFRISSMHPFQLVFGQSARAAAKSLSVSTTIGNGSVTGTIYYSKDILSNTLHIYCTLTSAAPANFDEVGNDTPYLMATLPAGYRPASDVPITANLAYAYITVDISNNFFTVFQIKGNIGTDGKVSLYWVKTGAGAVSIGASFNIIIPLD